MATETTRKRKALRIGTHSGTFHCDEALGCWMLKQTEDFMDAEIVRTRDPNVLKDLDVVIDVGGVYDPSTARFDHHQKTFAESFGYGFSTKLSSAGLVYRHFGKNVVGKLLGMAVDDPDMEKIYLHVYKTFIEAVDAVDNGINQWKGDAPPLYVDNTNLASRVSKLNPKWNEESSAETLYKQFLKAVELTGSEFAEAVKYIGQCWLPARQYAEESFAQRMEVDPSGEIFRLNLFYPWKQHLYEIEEENGLSGIIKYCLYEDDREHQWRIQAVAEAPGSFKSRKPLPESWRGIRNDELDAVVGIPGCVFVHSSGFIGGHKTYEGALEMARKALKAD